VKGPALYHQNGKREFFARKCNEQREGNFERSHNCRATSVIVRSHTARATRWEGVRPRGRRRCGGRHSLAPQHRCGARTRRPRTTPTHQAAATTAATSTRDSGRVLSWTDFRRACCQCRCQNPPRPHVTRSKSRTWRRGELNPCPRSGPRKHLHAYPVVRFKEPNVAPAHCRLPSAREIPSPPGAVTPPND
jgi:hypothetical protein